MKILIEARTPEDEIYEVVVEAKSREEVRAEFTQVMPIDAYCAYDIMKLAEELGFKVVSGDHEDIYRCLVNIRNLDLW